MTELVDIFAELGISQYVQVFLDQGFDTWETILDITESDLDVLGVKLGHRRKLQRKIANSRGLSSDIALGSPSRNTPSDDQQAEDQKLGGSKSEAKEAGSGPNIAKRKYRRHPKPDENAPERPPSAYVILSNRMREELKGRNLTFTEIAKLVGENWQNLSAVEKEPYEQQAFAAKERYNNALADYKKTNEYADYSQYLADFKARQTNNQQQDAAKRPKLEAHQSTASSSTASSGVSIYGDAPATGRTRVESSASSSSQWPVHESHPSPQLTDLKKLDVGVTKSLGSPSTSSPTVLPGYRDTVLNGGHQTPASRDGYRDDSSIPGQQLPRVKTAATARRSSYTGPPIGNPLNLTGSLRNANRTGQGSHQPPPLSSSESTAGRLSGSLGSTNSSMLYSPGTPLEPSLDRALPIPPPYPHTSTGSFDKQHQLPPLRPPSLSPQTSALGSQQSPNGIHAIVDYPRSMQSHAAPKLPQVPAAENNDLRHRDYLSASSPDDNNLDPVSALLKAGEIVNNRTLRDLPWPS